MTDLTAETFTAPFAVIDDFLPMEVALSMRADIEKHFGTPDKHRAETHQVWNYWYVLDTYTYLRTVPENIIEKDKVATFIAKLRDWTVDRLGLGMVTWPILSLYIDGCNQQLHNDSMNGRFAFVYSLTKPERRTIGGGTIVMHAGDPFRRNLYNPTAMGAFCEVIEPRFNRLVIFDDRMIHGVERVEGSMNPVEGRFVLHGHIEEDGPLIAGPLSREVLQAGLQETLRPFVSECSEQAYKFHGPISVRFNVGPDGAVNGLGVVLDRVTHISERDADGWPALRDKFLEAIGRARFAPTGEPSTVVLPMAFAGPAGKPVEN